MISSISRLPDHLPVNANWQPRRPAMDFQAAHQTGLPKLHQIPVAPQLLCRADSHLSNAVFTEKLQKPRSTFISEIKYLLFPEWAISKFIFSRKISVHFPDGFVPAPSLACVCLHPKKKKKKDFPWTMNCSSANVNWWEVEIKKRRKEYC